MSPKADEIYQQALQLDASERSDLIARLLASLDADEERFRQLLRERVEEIRTGAVETVELEEALARIATPPDTSER